MEFHIRSVTVLLLVTTLSVASVVGATLFSVGLIFILRATLRSVIRILATLGEIFVALVAALASGATVTLSVLVAAGSAAMVVPAVLLEVRVGVSVAISAAAIIAASSVVLLLTVPAVDMDVAVAVISAASVAVASAAAWAVGVMSLIEKETHQVGLKMTSLLDAVRHNKHYILRLLVKLNTGFKKRDKDLDLALLHAVKAGFKECTEILLGAGANPDTQDGHGNTPTILACEIGAHDLLKTLIDVGANVNVKNTFRTSPLHYAAKWGHKECVSLLLTHGADVNTQDAHWRTPLMLAAVHAHDANDVMRMLIDTGCNVNIVGFESRRAIHLAASRGLDVDALLAAGADPSCPDEEGNMPLHYAAFAGNLKVTQSLLRHGCDPDYTNFHGKNALHFAAIQGKLEIFELLVEANGDAFLVEPSGRTPLYYAAEQGHLNIVIYILRRRCPENTSTIPPDDGGIRPLNPVAIALERKRFDVVRALVIGGYNGKPVCDWMQNGQFDRSVQGQVEHISWLQNFLCNPLSLSHLCRLSIRRCLGPNLGVAMKALPLPASVKSYVAMEDLQEVDFATSIAVSEPIFDVQ